MAEVYELHPGTEPTHNYRGNKEGVRPFRVVGALPFAISPGMMGTNGTPLPNVSQAHPTIPNMRVDEIFAGDFGNGTDSLVEVRYSSNRSWRAAKPPVDCTEMGFASWSIQPSRESIIIPIARKGPYDVQIPGGSPVLLDAWQRVDFDYKQTMAVLQWRGSVPGFDPTSWSPIFDRDNELHKIGGRYYRFEAGFIEQIDERWEVRYSWIYDGGTKRPASWATPPPNQAYPPIAATVGGIPLIREPWRELYMIPSVNVLTTPPTWDQSPVLHHAVDNGWQTLPGGPV